MASPALEHRVTAVEVRLADIEAGYSETLYKLRRAGVKSELRMGRILEALNIQDVSENEIDDALDET